MNNEIQINVENYLLEQLPPIDRDNRAEFLSAMGVSKYRDSYQLEHNKFARFFKNYVVVVFQNNRSDLAIYNEILRLADETVILSEDYYRGCLHVRNRYMVDESSVIISYLRKESGGSAFTTGYARKKGIEIIEV